MIFWVAFVLVVGLPVAWVMYKTWPRDVTVEIPVDGGVVSAPSRVLTPERIAQINESFSAWKRELTKLPPVLTEANESVADFGRAWESPYPLSDDQKGKPV